MAVTLQVSLPRLAVRTGNIQDITSHTQNDDHTNAQSTRERMGLGIKPCLEAPTKNLKSSGSCDRAERLSSCERAGAPG